jgi:hypothetical protein
MRKRLVLVFLLLLSLSADVSRVHGQLSDEEKRKLFLKARRYPSGAASKRIGDAATQAESGPDPCDADAAARTTGRTGRGGNRTDTSPQAESVPQTISYSRHHPFEVP